MTSVVVDASVVVAWYAEEVGSAAARRLQAAAVELIAPSFLLVETAHALLRKARKNLVPPGHAAAVLKDLRRGTSVELVELVSLATPAAILAERLRHPVYDCLYLALAQREQAMLATLDQRLAALAGQCAIPLWTYDA